MAEKRCYTVKEIQEMLGICRVTVYDLLKNGKFPYVKVGGKYLVSKNILTNGSIHPDKSRSSSICNWPKIIFNPTYKKNIHIRYIYKSPEECSKNASREIFALKDLSFGIYFYRYEARYEAEIFIESICICK